MGQRIACAVARLTRATVTDPCLPLGDHGQCAGDAAHPRPPLDAGLLADRPRHSTAGLCHLRERPMVGAGPAARGYVYAALAVDVVMAMVFPPLKGLDWAE